MSTNIVSEYNPNRTHDTEGDRRIIRTIAAGLSALTAVIYLLIGFNIVTVLNTPTDQVFGFPAAIASVLGAVLLIWLDRRIVWILGAAFQVFVIYMYFNLAGQRSPDYEFWGVLLRVPQLIILVTLAYLSIRWPFGPPAQPTGRRPESGIR
ncbi:MAG: hypothetical protein K8I30_18220 [Anaerolineae bacterium]|nr:hypothetical protein [Anaerolineae bacterium]